MSAITIDGDLVHYEKLGRGKPVVLVHGWIGSWRYWIPVMSQLHNKFSVYTLDLIGFGDSAKNASHYSIDSQVKMLDKFLERLGIPRVVLIGHGLGAMICTRFALKYPDRVVRMMLTSLPLFDPGDLDERIPAGTRQLLTPGNNTRYSLAPQMDEPTSSDKTVPSGGSNANNGGNGMYTPFHELPTVGKEGIDREKLRQAAEARRKRNQANELRNVFKNQSMVDLLDKSFRKNEPEYEKLKVDVVKSDSEVLTKSAEGFEAGTMLDDLRRVTAPIVAIHGEDDPIIPLPTDEIWNYLTVQREEVFVPIPLPNVRHFPMLEDALYTRLASTFLDKSDIREVAEVRPPWRRRSR